MRFRATGPILLLAVAAASALAAPQKTKPPRPVLFDAGQRVTTQTYASAVTQAETTVAVSPSTPDNMVAGFFDRQPTPSERVCGHAWTLDVSSLDVYAARGALQQP